jgi:FkbM family methyltransferase
MNLKEPQSALLKEMQSVPEQSLKTVRVSDGMEVFCLSRSEATWIYDEVKGYITHGIRLKPGDVVFDVGANVGMFAVYLNYLLQGDAKIYSFEPIPAIFHALQKNAQKFNPTGIQTFCYGLAEQATTVEFDYYPEATVLSNAYAGQGEGVDLARDIMVRNPQHAPYPGRVLQWLPYKWREWVFETFVTHYFKAERVACQLRRLSEVIEEYQIQQIDLLKVDVEKSELSVLLGLDAADWAKVQQVVVEVHNVDNRVDTVVDLLKQHEFDRIVVEQEPLFEGSVNYNVYALR